MWPGEGHWRSAKGPGAHGTLWRVWRRSCRSSGTRLCAWAQGTGRKGSGSGGGGGGDVLERPYTAGEGGVPPPLPPLPPLRWRERVPGKGSEWRSANRRRPLQTRTIHRGDMPTPPPPPGLLPFQCSRLTAKILLRHLRRQEDLRLKTFDPLSAGTIGGPWEEGGPSQPPPPLLILILIRSPPPPSNSSLLGGGGGGGSGAGPHQSVRCVCPPSAVSPSRPL